LLLLVGFKLALLGVVLFEPEMNFDFLLPAQSDVLEAWQQPSTQLDGQPGGQPAADQNVAAAIQAAKAIQPVLPVSQVGQTVASAGQPESARKSTQQPVVSQSNSASQTSPVRSRRAPGVAFAATPQSITQAQNMPQGQALNQPQSGALSLEALNRKQEELARKEQDIKQLQAELDDRFVQLQGLEQRIKIMLKDADELKDARYRHLVDVLANMKARQAAEVLSTLDEKIAVRVLAGMQGRQAGEILSFADPVKAARLTESLARMQMPLE
jgi:flagellar motility protein MotE (MotC chaperone)